MAVEIVELPDRVFECEMLPDEPGVMRRTITLRLLSGPDLTPEEAAAVQQAVVRELIARGNRVIRANFK